jgi:hypothetical protein
MDSSSSGYSLTEPATDGLAAGLFASFVVLVFLGYLYPSFPYGGLAAVPLFGSLATLFAANLKADRTARSHPPASSS